MNKTEVVNQTESFEFRIDRNYPDPKKVEETKRIFAGTSIIETLEEIKESNKLFHGYREIIDYEHNSRFAIRAGLCKNKFVKKIIPMDIEFCNDSVTAAFSDEQIFEKHYFTQEKIVVSKSDENFKIIHLKENNGSHACCYNSSKEIMSFSSTNPAEIIEKISNIVAAKQTTRTNL